MGEVLHRLFTVAHNVQRIADPSLLECPPRDLDIFKVVLNKQHGHDSSPFLDPHCSFSSVKDARRSVNRKVEPFPGSDSAQILPPCLRIIFRQSASPTPAPSYGSLGCRRSKRPKIFSRNWRLM